MIGDDAFTGVQFWKGVQKGNSNAFTWTNITGNAPTEAGQCRYDLHLHAAPFTGSDNVTKDLLYAGTFGVGASFGDGVWYNLSHTYSGQDAFHTDQHTMAYNPFKPDEVIVGKRWAASMA